MTIPHFAQQGIQDKFRFSTFCFQYITYLVQFVLSVILEPKGKKTYDIITEVHFAPIG